MTDAERCRKNGWVVGDRLRGTEGKGKDWENTAVIQITAIGESKLLARLVESNGVQLPGEPESTWTLEFRRWRRVR